MKTLLSCLLLSSLTLQAQDSLKNEIVGLLKAAIAEAEGLPEGMTPDLAFQLLSEDGLNSSLTQDQASQLDQGKAVRSAADFEALAKQTNTLSKIEDLLPTKSLMATLAGKETSARQREAGCRLLEFFNKEKIRITTADNVTKAGMLMLDFDEDPKPMKFTDFLDREVYPYTCLSGDLPWLFKREGYGKLEDIKGLGLKGTVVLMGPTPFDGKLVVACSDGEAYAIPLKDIKGALDLSEVKSE